MPEQSARPGQLNAVIDPKLLFLAKLAARHKGQSLVEFIEAALEYALRRDVALKDDDETMYGHDAPAPQQQPDLVYEDLWDEDERVRMFNAAIYDPTMSLLTPKQSKRFDVVTRTLIKQGKKVTLKNFITAYDLAKDGE